MRILAIISLVVLVSACSSTQKLSKKGQSEIQYVEKFIEGMKDFGDDKLGAFIAPSYLENNKLDLSEYQINTYMPAGYEVKEWDKNAGIATTLIWGEDKGWVHRLTFKVVKESGKMYLYPMKHSDDFIHPWHSVETYIKDY